jgi:hypothetical protein
MDVGGGGSCWHDRLLSSGLRIQRQAVRGVRGKQRVPRAEHLAARKRRGTFMINYSARAAGARSSRRLRVVLQHAPPGQPSTPRCSRRDCHRCAFRRHSNDSRDGLRVKIIWIVATLTLPRLSGGADRLVASRLSHGARFASDPERPRGVHELWEPSWAALHLDGWLDVSLS